LDAKSNFKGIKMSEKYTSLEHTIRSIVTAPKQVNEYLQYAIPTAKTIFKMGTAPSNLPAVVNSTKAAATKAAATKTVPTVPVPAIAVPPVAPAAVAPPAVITAPAASPIAAALPVAMSAASGVSPAVAPALSTLTKTQTAVAPQTQTKTLTKAALATAAATGVTSPRNNNGISPSASFDSEPRTAGNSKTLTTTKDIPKKRRKAVGESVDVIRRVIEEAKKKEKKGGKNPLVDLEPKLKDQELDQG
jgi:hypothetical protein